MHNPSNPFCLNSYTAQLLGEARHRSPWTPKKSNINKTDRRINDRHPKHKHAHTPSLIPIMARVGRDRVKGSMEMPKPKPMIEAIA
jgi:hypothetical protein